MVLNQWCYSSDSDPMNKGKTNLVDIEYNFYYVNQHIRNKQTSFWVLQIWNKNIELPS